MTNLALSKDALATAPQQAVRLYVVFKVSDAEYAIESSAVLQMEAFAGATAVPGTPPFIVGVMPIRGRVVPVLDLHVRFGFAPATPTLESRVVVGQLGDRTVALLADSAREVLRIPDAELKAPPAMLDPSTGFVKAIAHVGGRVILVLDFAKVIGEEPANVR
jgi:purine-binding chemotaxis protein CheW